MDIGLCLIHNQVHNRLEFLVILVVLVQALLVCLKPEQNIGHLWIYLTLVLVVEQELVEYLDGQYMKYIKKETGFLVTM